LTKVKLRDIAADDNGVWTTSTPHRMYEVERKHGEVVSVRHVANIGPGVDKKKVVTVCKHITVLDYNGVVMPRAIIQYFFLGGIKVPVSHGNSKAKERPYYRTQPRSHQRRKQG
jgi:hypothetical protein